MKKINLLLLTLIVLSVSVFVNAQDEFTVPAGDDTWITDSTNTSDVLNLPAGYFGTGSYAFNETVYFAGDPASGNEYDTKITRNNAVPLGNGSGTTSLTVAELRLKSVSPITVRYDGRTEQYDVYLTLSSTPSTGTMTITGDASGGTFSSTLNIFPKFTFVRVDGLGATSEKGRTVKVLDFGSPFIQQYLKEQARLASDRLRRGKGTSADEAAVAICRIDTPIPTEPIPTEQIPTTRTTTTTTQNATGTSPSCSVKLSGNGRWKCGNGCFCPVIPIQELALYARHGVIPFCRCLAVP